VKYSELLMREKEYKERIEFLKGLSGNNVYEISNCNDLLEDIGVEIKINSEKEINKLLYCLVELLSEENFYYVCLRYGIGGGDKRSYGEIAKIMNRKSGGSIGRQIRSSVRSLKDRKVEIKRRMEA